MLPKGMLTVSIYILVYINKKTLIAEQSDTPEYTTEDIIGLAIICNIKLSR
jgi:hypothetical protein